MEYLTAKHQSTFLQVRICREKASGKIFAIKKLNKAEMLKRGQVEHVKAERNVLAEVHNPYVVKLFYSFQVTCSPPLGIPPSPPSPGL